MDNLRNKVTLSRNIEDAHTFDTTILAPGYSPSNSGCQMFSPGQLQKNSEKLCFACIILNFHLNFSLEIFMQATNIIPCVLTLNKTREPGLSSFTA